ncbi:MAG: hypothetical protein Q7T54_03285 [Candidatus Levybacteria bacterium]|nr:hypothetical protein [Candidatus Levybacteria bacterium]
MKIVKANWLFLSLFILAAIISASIFFTYFGTSAFRLPYHDAFKFDFPNRFFISKSINNGILPLWDQWSHNGLPTSLNISFINISPVILLISLFGIYTPQTLMIEMLLMQFLALVGMFFWLKEYSNKWLALVGAFFFSLSPPILSTATNASVIATMCTVPLIAYSFKKTLQGSLRHSGLFSLALIIVFTSGYLGTNVLYLPIIFMFCLLEEIIINKSNFRNISKGFAFLILGGVLFLAATSIGWIELWHYTGFDLSSLRYGHYDPFTGGNSLKILYSLFFVHNFPPYVPLGAIVPVAGNGYEIYFGVVNFIFALFCLLNRKDFGRSILIFCFLIVIFCISLAPEYDIPVIASKFLPFLTLSRWHGWYTLLLSFFSLTLAIRGFDLLISQKSILNFKLIAISGGVVVALMLLAIYKLISRSSYSGDFFVLQLTCAVGIILFAVYLHKNPTFKKKVGLVFISFIFVGLSIIEFVPNSLNYLTYRNDTWNETAHMEMKKIFEDQRSNTFSYKKNERQVSNYQLVTGIPSPYGYTPMSTPAMLKLRAQIGEDKYTKISMRLFWISDPLSAPSKQEDIINITKFEPNAIDLTIENKEGQRKILWTNSFSTHWKLNVNGKPQVLEKTSNGFSAFTVGNGKSLVKLQYEPKYSLLAFVIMATAYALIIFLFVFYRNRTYNNER